MLYTLCFLNELFDFRNGNVLFDRVAGNGHKRRSLLDFERFGKRHVLFGENLREADLCFIKEGLRDLAVGAGLGGEQEQPVVRWRSGGRGDCAVGGGGVLPVAETAALQPGVGHVVFPPVLELLDLAVVPVLDGAVVAGYTAVHLGRLAALGAGELLAHKVAVVLADGVGRGHGVVGQLVVLRDLAHEVRRRLPARQLLAEEGVEDRAGGVERLQLILHVERGEDVLGIADGQVGGVGVVRVSARLGSGDDVGEGLDVVLCETVGGGLRRGGLKVIEVTMSIQELDREIARVKAALAKTTSNHLKSDCGKYLRKLYRQRKRLKHES